MSVITSEVKLFCSQSVVIVFNTFGGADKEMTSSISNLHSGSFSACSVDRGRGGWSETLMGLRLFVCALVSDVGSFSLSFVSLAL